MDEDYSSIYTSFADQVERWLLKALIGLVIALLISQILMKFSYVRSILSRAEKLEGVPYLQQQVSGSSATFKKTFTKE